MSNPLDPNSLLNKELGDTTAKGGRQMNKDKLKEKLLLFYHPDDEIFLVDELVHWITSNFISKEEVEGLKMEKLEIPKSIKEFSCFNLPSEVGDIVLRSRQSNNEGYNQAVDEINSKINNLIK